MDVVGSHPPRHSALVVAISCLILGVPRSLVLLAMEVIAYDRLVTDFEALECIRSRRRERQANGVDTEPPEEASGALAAEEATERYLSKMPAAQQTREKVSACWQALSEHHHFCKLTTPEKLQMINHRPLQPVAVHLMIEDCHRRFREDRIVDDLIALLEKHLGCATESSD